MIQFKHPVISVNNLLRIVSYNNVNISALKIKKIIIIKIFHYLIGCFQFVNSLQMALRTLPGCSQYFRDNVFPRLEETFPNVVYQPGSNFADIMFQETRRYKGLRKYNKIRVSVDPLIQRVPIRIPRSTPGRPVVVYGNPPPIYSGKLMLNDESFPCCLSFRWYNRNAMIDKIGELERNECCNVCVLMWFFVVNLVCIVNS